VKSTRTTIGRSIERPDPNIRFYLFHGPDEAQSRGLAMRLTDSLGATKHLVSSSSIKSDPALLVDEAAAMSLFGGRRVVWIDPATKDIEGGLAALLEGPRPENVVAAISGVLTKTSALLKVAEGSPHALAHASYVPEGQDAERMVIEIGRRFGLKISPPVAARLAHAADNDQAIVTQELQKLAIYVDASPHSPKELETEAVDDVGVDSSEGDLQKLADLALTGETDRLYDELAKLPASGNDAIPILRSLQRRLLMLAPARARVERGERIDAVMASLGKALFWKDKLVVQQMLVKWNAADLARMAARAGKLERALVFSTVPERESLGEELFAIARKARRL